MISVESHFLHLLQWYVFIIQDSFQSMGLVLRWWATQQEWADGPPNGSDDHLSRRTNICAIWDVCKGVCCSLFESNVFKVTHCRSCFSTHACDIPRCRCGRWSTMTLDGRLQLLTRKVFRFTGSIDVLGDFGFVLLTSLSLRRWQPFCCLPCPEPRETLFYVLQRFIFLNQLCAW